MTWEMRKTKTKFCYDDNKNQIMFWFMNYTSINYSTMYTNAFFHLHHTVVSFVHHWTCGPRYHRVHAHTSPNLMWEIPAHKYQHMQWHWLRKNRSTHSEKESKIKRNNVWTKCTPKNSPNTHSINCNWKNVVLCNLCKNIKNLANQSIWHAVNVAIIPIRVVMLSQISFRLRCFYAIQAIFSWFCKTNNWRIDRFTVNRRRKKEQRSEWVILCVILVFTLIDYGCYWCIVCAETAQFRQR